MWLLLLLLLALQFLQELFRGFGRLLIRVGRLLLLLVVLGLGCIGSLFRTVGSIFVLVLRSATCFRRNRALPNGGHSGSRLEDTLGRETGAIGWSRGSGFGSTGFGSQSDALDGGGVGGGADHDVVEVGAIEKVSNDFPCRTGAEIGDDTFGGSGRNIEISARLLVNGTEDVGQGAVVGNDGEQALFISDQGRHCGHLIERQGIERSRGVGRKGGWIGLLLLGRLDRRRLGLADATALGCGAQ